MKLNKPMRKLLFLFDLAGKIEGRKKIQRLVFLCKVRNWNVFPWKFIMYFEGPYSEDLQEVLLHLVVNGYLKERLADTKIYPSFEDRAIFEYTVTEKGRKYALKDETVEKVFKEYGHLSGDELEDIAMAHVNLTKRDDFEKEITKRDIPLICENCGARVMLTSSGFAECNCGLKPLAYEDGEILTSNNCPACGVRILIRGDMTQSCREDCRNNNRKLVFIDRETAKRKRLTINV